MRLASPAGCKSTPAAEYLVSMRVRSLGSRQRLKWTGEFEWSLGLGKLGSIAAEMLRRYGSPLSRVVVAEVMDLLCF